MLIYNSETWMELNEKTVKKLENLQNILLRCLLSVPNSTPIAALNWDTGLISVEYRVFQKKLNFLHHLVNLDKNSLANEIFCIQKENNLPGFVKECRKLLDLFSLPNIIEDDCPFSKLQWKRLIKEAIYKKYEESLKFKVKDYSKLKDGPMMLEKF